MQPVTASLARDLGLQAKGYRIIRVYPGSPLAAAGARVGDLLTGINDTPLRAANETAADGYQQQRRGNRKVAAGPPRQPP